MESKTKLKENNILSEFNSSSKLAIPKNEFHTASILNKKIKNNKLDFKKL